MGPPPIKSTKKLVKAETETRLKAEAKFALSPQGIEYAIIDMINRVDPIELMATISGTFVVYDVIKSTPEFLAQAKSFLFTPPLAIAWPILTIIIERIWGNQELTEEQKAEFLKLKKEFDSVLLLKSFFIAYIMIKHSGQIISGLGNVSSFIAGFLGLKMKV